MSLKTYNDRARLQGETTDDPTARPKAALGFDIGTPPPPVICTETNVIESKLGSIYYAQKQNRANEDRLAIHLNRAGDEILLQIFDGHSSKRSSSGGSADLAQREFGRTFFGHLANGHHPLESFSSSLRSIHSQIERKGLTDGSTATAAYIRGDDLFGCILGDSPATLFRDTGYTRLTYIESWTDQEATDRIALSPQFTTVRNRLLHMPTNRSLAITRALGDLPFAPAVIQEPILWTTSRASPSWLVLASDGLTNLLTEHEISVVLSRWDGESNPAELLVAKALEFGRAYCELRMLGPPEKALDDISVIAFNANS